MAVIVPAAIGAVELGYGIYSKAHAASEAKKAARQRPVYQTPPQATSEYNLAASELARGLSPEAEQAYETNLDKGFSTSVGAIERLGGGPNNIAEVYDATEQGRQNLAMMKEQLRMAQVQQVVGASRNLQEQYDKEFQINEYAPYVDRVAAIGQERQESANIEAMGVSTLGSAASSWANSQQFKNFFKPQQSSISVQSTGPVTSTSAASYYSRQAGPDLGMPAPGTSTTPRFNSLDVSGNGDDNYFNTLPINE